MFSYTTAPLVRRSISMPACRVSSFSGISPTDSSRVSQSNIIDLPGTGLRFTSTSDTTTCSTRSFPRMSVTVWDRYRGIS